jgi:flagellum-specific peptidoglycan hydrolase FlgJ
MALEKSAAPAPSDNAALRSAIVNVARHFLRMAGHKSPAEMEAIIWHHVSLDGADHGPSCAAFASLTLALGSHVAGHESWVTGGTSYPWPLHPWADARVDPNPASPNVMSVLQEAQGHHRWHPLGDGYDPQPGDWVLFDGHVEVVTNYNGGVLHTIGGDSLPNYSVNAHSYPSPLSGQGVAGFVDNGLQPAASVASGGQSAAPGGRSRPAHAAQHAQAGPKSKGKSGAAAGPGRAAGVANAPGTPVSSPAVLAPRAIPAPREVPQSPFAGSRALVEPGLQTDQIAAGGQQAAPRARAKGTAPAAPKQATPRRDPRGNSIPGGRTGQPAHLVQGRESGKADIPGTVLQPEPAPPRARPGQAEIPGLLKHAPRRAAPPRQLAPYQRHHVASAPQPTGPGSALQRAFIEQVAPGAMATQRRYGVPASVTIAQAIDESAWGQSILATQDHNLFGIKGTGPAGSDLLPTQEFTGGQLVDTTAPFRVYNDIAQSIESHGKLLARSDYFTNAMANRHQPNAFAAALTGVYATDPEYGTKLIQLMQHYNLYRFNVAAAHSAPSAGGAAIPGVTGHASRAQGRTAAASASQRATGPATASHAQPTSGRAPEPAPAAQPGHGHGAAHAGQPASNQGARGHGASARQAQRTSSAEAGLGSDSAIPGTGYPVVGARRMKRTSDRADMPGQADIPGLPGTAAATPGHRARNAPRLRPAHPPPSGHRPGRYQPVRTAPADSGHRGSAPPSAEAGHVRPGQPNRRPAAPHAASATGYAHPGPVRQDASRGGAPLPGLAVGDSGQPGAGRAAHTTAGFGDALIPGLPLAPAGPMAAAYGSGDVPQYGAMPQDGAWIPGLPGAGAEAGGHAAHRTGGARRGPGRTGAGHGTNIPPTPARRIAPAGAPSSQAGNRAAPGYDPVPGAHPAPAPASAHRPAARAAPVPVGPAVTAPAATSAIPGRPAGGPAAGRRMTTAPASPAAPSGAPGPAPVPGAASPAVAPAGPPSPPTPSPASAGTTYGAGEPLPATTTAVTAVRYSHHLPPAVGKAYLNSAKMPLVRGEPLYVDVAAQSGISWEILAACDWMQCRAKSGLSPVYGEKLGAVNPDGTSYRTRSAALERCAYDLVELARSVYQIDLTRGEPLSVRELASAFAAFRWGGLLKEHHTSAMEFPYSVAGLTTQHMHMRWPNIDDPQAPDKPGARFHQPFGAVPLVLSLSYPAIA